MAESNKKIVYVIAIVAAIAGLLFGFDTGVINGALSPMSTELHITDDFLKGLIVAFVPLGALFGSMISPLFANHLGRKYSILISGILFLISTYLVSISLGVSFVLIGRFFMGISIGISATIVPMYLSEISPTRIRGALVVLFQLAVTIGLVMAFLVNHFFDDNWRGMFLFGVLPSSLFIIGMFFLPQSPRWLYMKQKTTKATTVIQKLNPTSEVKQILDGLDQAVTHKQNSLITLLKDKHLFKLVCLAFGLFVAQQLTGVNTIFYYSTHIFRDANLNLFANNTATIATIICGLVNVLSTVIAIWIIEVLGRRMLLIYGMIGQIFALFICGGALAHSFGDVSGIIALFAVVLFIFFFAVSLGGLPYVLMAEIFPLSAREKGMAIANCANWGFNFLVSVSFLALVDYLGIDHTFYLYALLTLVALLIFIKVMPETKNVSLETIESHIYAGKNLRHIGQTS
ncbi:sugar porter family MFS transporter [Thiotrichales bacterium 19S3-7]|nr:sugar porter family MFS transporter [Thiotrichales bacterium 19S3-7]MCF6802409.1 sugar porter family MFS transporter [Thiotrichales bacterium 19S3-11]